MRIRTNALASQLEDAARTAGVTFARLNTLNSRSHAVTFDVVLSGSSRRYSGSTERAMAAMWDEWGIFLAEVFKADPTTSTPYYRNETHFHWATDNRFRRTLTQKCDHKWVWNGTVGSGSYSVRGCDKCGTQCRTASKSWMRENSLA